MYSIIKYHMKIILVSLYVAFSFSLDCLGGDCLILFKISVISQNANAEFDSLAPDVARSPGIMLNYAKRIDVLLNSLVDKGSFSKESVELKAPKNMSIQEQNELSEIVVDYSALLALEYGMYSSLEMLDFGLRRGLIDDADKKTIVLNIRMPKKRMAKFVSQIQKFKKVKKRKHSTKPLLEDSSLR